MNDLAFVICNLKLNNKQTRRTHIYDFDDINSDDEWITEGGKSEDILEQ